MFCQEFGIKISSIFLKKVFKSKNSGVKNLSLKAIILTHFDRDTIGGLQTFLKCNDDPSIPVYIHENAKVVVEETQKLSGANRLINWRKAWLEGDFIQEDDSVENLGKI